MLALREGKEWRFIGHVGTGFTHETLKELHGKLIKLEMAGRISALNGSGNKSDGGYSTFDMRPRVTTCSRTA